jgi:exonuclease III
MGRRDDLEYIGAFHGVTWNTQGLLAYDPMRQTAKLNQLYKYLGHADLIMMQETHSTAGITSALRIPAEYTAWWSHLSRHTGGVGLMIKKTFLRQSRAVRIEDWEETIPGRLSMLHLRGHMGNLSIAVVYFCSGHHTANKNEDRDQMRVQLATRMAARSDTTWIVAGDFNWVTTSTGRVELGDGRYTGAQDEAEERHWQLQVQRPRDLHELQQHTHTFRSHTATSRLDRVYTNHHASTWLLGSSAVQLYPGRTYLTTGLLHLVTNRRPHDKHKSCCGIVT